MKGEEGADCTSADSSTAVHDAMRGHPLGG